MERPSTSRSAAVKPASLRLAKAGAPNPDAPCRYHSPQSKNKMGPGVASSEGPCVLARRRCRGKARVSVYYPLPGQPTDFPPRSFGKLRVMEQRARRREPIFDPRDAPMPDDIALLGDRPGNGEDPFLIAVAQVRGSKCQVIEEAPPPDGRERSAQELIRNAQEHIRAFEAFRKRRERRRKQADAGAA